MQIEMGKQYQTRDGRPVRVLCTDAPGEYPVVGYVISDGIAIRSWTADGLLVADAGISDSDLIPVPEKRRLKGWVNVYGATCIGPIHPTKELADKRPEPSRIACVPIDIEYTVGEGLNKDAT